MAIAVVLSTIFVMLGLVKLPYSYFMLLRIVLCITAALGVKRAREAKNNNWVWVYAILAVLYNPVLPVHIGDKSVWAVVNIATVVIFWVGLSKFEDVRHYLRELARWLTTASGDLLATTSRRFLSGRDAFALYIQLRARGISAEVASKASGYNPSSTGVVFVRVAASLAVLFGVVFLVLFPQDFVAVALLGLFAVLTIFLVRGSQRLRETVSTLRFYFILGGLLSCIQSYEVLCAAISSKLPLTTAAGLVDVGWGLIFVYIGAALRGLLQSSSQRIVILLYADACWEFVICLLSGVQTQELWKLGVRFLFLWYVATNVSRLEAEEKPSPTR